MHNERRRWESCLFVRPDRAYGEGAEKGVKSDDAKSQAPALYACVEE